MYKRIITNNTLSYKERIKSFIKYFMLRRSARIQWRSAFDIVYEKHPEFNNPIDASIEEAHRQYWKAFNKKVNLSTLRMSKHISGITNPKFIPEEIFFADIEPILNPSPVTKFYDYKSFYNHWFPGAVFPKDYFHNIEGVWFNSLLARISLNQVHKIADEIEYPVVLKPNRNSYGGKDVYFPDSKEELLKLIEEKKDFLVQEEIKKNSFYEQFGKEGLNTIRVNVYRSFKDNNWYVIGSAMRTGMSGSLDGLTAGGITSLINKDGFLNGYAIDSWGTKYLTHPDTGVTFNQKIPDFEGMKKFSLNIAGKLFYVRLACLDVCYDYQGNWKVIEVNINSPTLSYFAQHHGVEFFDGFTDEVYEYCLSNHWALR